jgi:hypothetical protein
MSCCIEPTVTFTRNDEQLIVGDHVQTNNAKCPTGVAIARGDLLKLTPATNTYALATAAGDFDAIAVETMTAVQTTYHAANVLEIAGYTQGEFAADMCSLAGVKLNAANQTLARGRGAQINIEIRKVVA